MDQGLSIDEDLQVYVSDEEEILSDEETMLDSKIMILSSRGVSYRHLMQDLLSLLANSKKEAKFDSKSELFELNDLADLNHCQNILFFESRKNQDLYLWLSNSPRGPTLKFYVSNIHTMDELHFEGNSISGSKPILSFDPSFENSSTLIPIKKMFIKIFAMPTGHKKLKYGEVHDRVYRFSFLDGKIWFRCYQISKTSPEIELVEIGPRFVLTHIKTFESSFHGRVLYSNADFVSPNQLRAIARQSTKIRRKDRSLTSRPVPKMPRDPTSTIFEDGLGSLSESES